MLYKYVYLAKEFELLCPKTKELAWLLDAFLKNEGYADMMITHVKRTEKQQEEFYWRAELMKLQGLQGASEETARRIARKKFSWHKVYCAFDMNSKRYTEPQIKEILKFLRNGRRDPCWEIYHHDVGQGPHIHVGYEDFTWRRKWEKEMSA